MNMIDFWKRPKMKLSEISIGNRMYKNMQDDPPHDEIELWKEYHTIISRLISRAGELKIRTIFSQTHLKSLVRKASDRFLLNAQKVLDVSWPELDDPDLPKHMQDTQQYIKNIQNKLNELGI